MRGMVDSASLAVDAMFIEQQFVRSNLIWSSSKLRNASQAAKPVENTYYCAGHGHFVGSVVNVHRDMASG